LRVNSLRGIYWRVNAPSGAATCQLARAPQTMTLRAVNLNNGMPLRTMPFAKHGMQHSAKSKTYAALHSMQWARALRLYS